MNLNKMRVLETIQELSVIQGKEHIGFTTKELTAQLLISRSNLSTLLNQLVRENYLEKTNSRPVYYKLVTSASNYKTEESYFSHLIGSNGSLKQAVQSAKAAVLYPNHSLPLLISGSKGSGYHFLVETIQQFAVEQSILSKTVPFIKVPCAYFSQNPEELTRQLFQNRDTDKNLFVQAKQGVLFLDQIQFLNIEAKSRLHAYLESNPQEGPLIICSVQNAEDTFIQEPFAESFPIHIHLAPLGERPLAERLQFIQKFFKAEAKKMKRSLRVNSELLLCLLLYPCPGGIVQLKNEIQLGCANAYVRENLTSSKESRLYIHDFPAHIRKGVIHYKEFRQELEKLNIAEYTFSFSDLEMIKTKEKILLHQKKSIYDFIDKKLNN